MTSHTENYLATLTAVALISVAVGYTTSARADRWDWRNNPDRFGGTMVTELVQLPMSGEAEIAPWPPAYVPEDAANATVPGSVLDASDRYDVAFNGWSPDEPGDDEFQTAGPLYEYVSTGLGACASYAALDVDRNGTIDEQEDVGDDEFYLYADDEQEDSGDDEHYFWGLCHSWVAASILESEPMFTVTENGIEFSADELKSLLALEWAYASSHFVGGVCGLADETLQVDEDGFIIQPECADTNPGAFHLLLANLIGIEERSFAVDLDMSDTVTILPLASFEVTSLEETDAETANELLGLEGADYPFNDSAASFAHVTTDITLIDPGAWSDTRTDQYEYLLELDLDGLVIGGRWLGVSRTEHPDFSWLPLHNDLDVDSYEPDQVDDLVMRSLENDRDGDGVLDDVDSCQDEDATGLDADDDGCIDRVADLADLVVSLELHAGTERALVASAESAARDAGISAVNKLGAFVNKVEAQRGKKLDVDQANLLMSFAAHASSGLLAGD